MGTSPKTDEADGGTIDVEKLITEIQYNGRVIWDKRLSGHAIKTELSAAWDKVIENIGLDPKDKKNRSRVRARWTSLKNRFATETKKEPKLKSGSAPQTFTSKFEHYHRLLFLKETLKPAKSTGTYTELVEAAKAKEEAEVKANEEEEAKHNEESGSESDKEKEEEEENSSDTEKKEEVIWVDEESLTFDQKVDKNEEYCFEMAETTKSKNKSKTEVVTPLSDDSCDGQDKSDKSHLYVPQDEDMLFFSHLHKTMLRLRPATTFKLRKRFMEITDETMDNEGGPEVIVIDDDDDTSVEPPKIPKRSKKEHSYYPIQIKKEKVESDLDAKYQHARPSGAQNHGYYRVMPSPTEGYKNPQEFNQNQSHYAWRVPAQRYSQASDQSFFYQPPPPPPASHGQFYDPAQPYYRSDPAQLPLRVGSTAPANYEYYPAPSLAARASSVGPYGYPPGHPAVSEQQPSEPSSTTSKNAVAPNYPGAPSLAARASSVGPYGYPPGHPSASSKRNHSGIRGF